MTGPQLNLLVLRTAQIDGLLRCYEALGLELRPEQHGSGPAHFSATVEGLVIEIYPSSASTPIKRGGLGDVRLGFRVDDLEATVGRVIDGGGSLVSGAMVRDDHTAAVVADPDGRRIELTATH